MAYIETRDPFGFVGSHVVRNLPRKNREEHGWLTRYDEALDCYTLFVPNGGEPRLLARGEVMKFLSAPNIELYDDDQDNFPPPIKDTSTSRYLGVTLRRPRQGSKDEKSGVLDDMRGQVKCFLPFANRYSVEYEDGSTEEVSESAVIDGMIALIKSPFFSSSCRLKKQKESVRTQRENDGDDDDDELGPGRRKRQRIEITSTSDVPSASVAVVEDVMDDDDVVVIDQTKTETRADRKIESAPNILENTSSTVGCTTRENSLEMASCPVEGLEKDGVAGQDDIVEIQKLQEAPESIKSTNKTTVAQREIPNTVPFYIVDKKPHVAIEPLPRRAMAFEILRASLLNLLDHREAKVVKIALQYDLLRNPDLRDRDAVVRFVDADGLLVLNHLLNSFATDVLGGDDEENNEHGVDEKARERMERDDELLHVLKIVAMLPTPTRSQVIASTIGKTINYLSKARGPPGRRSALPKCISALARWIKSSWIKNIPPALKSTLKASRQLDNRPQQQARRGGRSGSSGRPSYQLNRRRPPPPHQRPQHQISSAPNAFHDKARSPRLTHPRHLAQPQQQPAPAQALSQLPVSRRVRGSLKPDWMRQKENLSRSRFCIDDSTNVDTTRPYRGSRVPPITNVPVVVSSSQAPTQQDQNSDQHEDAGGPDGVFGRVQKLRFGKRWSTQEFGIQDPPGTLRRAPGSSHSVPSYGRSQYSGHHSVRVPPVPCSPRRPRSILRRVSQYNDEPAIDGPT